MKKLRKPKPAANATLDQVHCCCERIETLAGLLESCDRLNAGDTLNPQLVGRAGFMIGEQAAGLRHWLAKLRRG